MNSLPGLSLGQVSARRGDVQVWTRSSFIHGAGFEVQDLSDHVMSYAAG
jgi:hypothetical protein